MRSAMVRPTPHRVRADEVRARARQLRRERHRHEDVLHVLRWLRARLRDHPHAVTEDGIKAWIADGERDALIEIRKLRHQTLMLLGDGAALSDCDDEQRAVLEQ